MNTKGNKFGRYATPTGAESEVEPGSRGRVLRNLKGITKKSAMDKLEFEALVRVQEKYLNLIEPTTIFTAKLIRTMHRDWFENIYGWAGKYRTVEMTKGEFTWPPAYLVEQNMDLFESTILKNMTPCRPGKIDRIALDIAEVHAEFLLIHPFREGNGRLGRWIAELMALQANRPLPVYKFTGKGSTAEREEYLNAVQEGYMQNYRYLADFFAEALERGEKDLLT